VAVVDYCMTSLYIKEQLLSIRKNIKLLESAQELLCSSILIENTEPNHQLYFDNFFSTYALFQWLKNKEIYAVGTIRINRFGNPPLMLDKLMKNKRRGFSQEVPSQNGNIIVTKWYDNKPVTLGSNYVSIGTEDKCSRWDKKTKACIDVQRPEVIQKYNQHMGGVDKLDFLF